MADRRIVHRINCNPETYWSKIFFDRAHNEQLFLGKLRFEVYEIVSSEETETEIRRVIRAVPRVGDVPGPLKKLLKNGAGYRENGVFDKQTQRYTVEVTPNSLADRLTITGITSVEPLADGNINRVYQATVIANVFGVGGMLEKRILDDIERSYEKAAAFSNQWIAENSL